MTPARQAMSNEELSQCGKHVRKHDPDRYFCTLFAPADKREALFALYAFDHELDRITTIVSEPILGEMRLQWWREAITGSYHEASLNHPIAQAMGSIRSRLLPELLEAMMDARSSELAGGAQHTLAGLVEHASKTSGALARQAVAILAPGEDGAEEVARDAGIAVFLTRMLRAAPGMTAQNQVAFPLELLVKHCLEPRDVLRGEHNHAMACVIQEIAGHARAYLRRSRSRRRLVPKEALAAFLPLGFAHYDLSTLKRNDYNIFSLSFQRHKSRRHLTVLARGLFGRY